MGENASVEPAVARLLAHHPKKFSIVNMIPVPKKSKYTPFKVRRKKSLCLGCSEPFLVVFKAILPPIPIMLARKKHIPQNHYNIGKDKKQEF